MYCVRYVERPLKTWGFFFVTNWKLQNPDLQGLLLEKKILEQSSRVCQMCCLGWRRSLSTSKTGSFQWKPGRSQWTEHIFQQVLVRRKLTVLFSCSQPHSLYTLPRPAASLSHLNSFISSLTSVIDLNPAPLSSTCPHITNDWNSPLPCPDCLNIRN